MTTLFNADTSDGLKITSDTSGEIALQSAGTTIATVSSTGLAMASGKTLTGDAISALAYGLFSKIDPTVVGWNKTGAFTLTTNTGLYIEVNGDVKTIASATSITMPSATAGTDYAIWCTTAGALEATTDHVSPPSANARKVGGFHYAPGGNATGT